MDTFAQTLAAGVVGAGALTVLAWSTAPKDVRDAVRRWWGTFR